MTPNLPKMVKFSRAAEDFLAEEKYKPSFIASIFKRLYFCGTATTGNAERVTLLIAKPSFCLPRSWPPPRLGQPDGSLFTVVKQTRSFNRFQLYLMWTTYNKAFQQMGLGGSLSKEPGFGKKTFFLLSMNISLLEMQ